MECASCSRGSLDGEEEGGVSREGVLAQAWPFVSAQEAIAGDGVAIKCNGVCHSRPLGIGWGWRGHRARWSTPFVVVGHWMGRKRETLAEMGVHAQALPLADDDGLPHMESELCESIDFSDEDEAATGIVQRMFHMIRTEACPLLLLIENREVTHLPP